MREQNAKARAPQRRNVVQMENVRRQQDWAAREGRRNPYLQNYGQAKRTASIRQQPLNRQATTSVHRPQTAAANQYSRTSAAYQSSQTSAARRRSRVVQQRNKRRQRIRTIRILLCLLCCVGVVALFATMLMKFFDEPQIDGSIAPGQEAQEAGAFDGLLGEKVQGISGEAFAKHPQWEENFLTPNEYSRPGEALEEVKNIFVHYTANPGTSAAQNRSYFEQQKDTHDRSVSAHFIIGYEGEIIQCLPLDEIGYAVQTRNYDSISIECCYLADDGSFTQETYDSLISLLKWLTEAYSLDEEDILRHYDCGGKKCPLYYTEHEDAWERLKRDVREL